MGISARNCKSKVRVPKSIKDQKVSPQQNSMFEKYAEPL